MVHGFESPPEDETKERVSDPCWACAGALAAIAVIESSAIPDTLIS
jgi:hypothetical protein